MRYTEFVPRTRAVAVLRCSTDSQADRGLSLSIQHERVRDYARLYDIELVEVIEDAGFSGKNLRRPGLNRALAMLEAGKADALLVAKLDRLTRSVRDLGILIAKYFEEGRFSLMSVGEQIDTRSAGGRLVLNVLASVSQWEREKISERISEAMALKATRGEYLGGETPFGWDVGPDGKHLVKNPSEQEVIAVITDERSRGASLRKISDRLHARGHRPRRGARFHPTTISRILKATTSSCLPENRARPTAQLQ